MASLATYSDALGPKDYIMQIHAYPPWGWLIPAPGYHYSILFGHLVNTRGFEVYNPQSNLLELHT